MTPELRAIADRLTWEGALIEYATTLIEPHELGATVEATGWTVRQTLAHLGINGNRHADALTAIVNPGAAGDRDQRGNDETVAEAQDRELEEILDDLVRHRARMFALMEPLDEAAAATVVDGGRTVLNVVRYWSGHYIEHAWDLLGACPALGDDALLVNWLAHGDYAAVGRPELGELAAGLARLVYTEEPAPGESDRADDE